MARLPISSAVRPLRQIDHARRRPSSGKPTRRPAPSNHTHLGVARRLPAPSMRGAREKAGAVRLLPPEPSLLRTAWRAAAPWHLISVARCDGRSRTAVPGFRPPQGRGKARKQAHEPAAHERYHHHHGSLDRLPGLGGLVDPGRELVDLGGALGQFEEHGCAEQPEDRQFHDRRPFWSAYDHHLRPRDHSPHHRLTRGNRTAGAHGHTLPPAIFALRKAAGRAPLQAAAPRRKLL